jgi:hypothetical protein
MSWRRCRWTGGFCYGSIYKTRLLQISKVGQNHIYTPYTTVYLVIPLPQLWYIH